MRVVTYSPETIAAYGAVIDAGLVGGADEILEALRHLMQMVHSDFTGELREPHTYKTDLSSMIANLAEVVREAADQ